MLQYLVVLLDVTSVSYCYCDNFHKQKKLISLEDLKSGILFAMKENLLLQFVYPDYMLPEHYQETIENIDHVKIMPVCHPEYRSADVVISQDWKDINAIEKVVVVRVSKENLFASELPSELPNRLNIVIKDIDSFGERDFERYTSFLSKLSEIVKKEYALGKRPQVNLLTDRLILEKMNNCNAGNQCLTLAPNGNYYICPAFYYDNENESIGDLATGITIRNQQLYSLSFSPICRLCDSYQCKRCVWMNKKTTLEVNTPSHEQCVVSHIERNASKKLLEDFQKEGFIFPINGITEIDYLDPFEKANQWKVKHKYEIR